MYILHIETSTKICSVALSREDQLVDWEDRGNEMNHAAILAPMIADILERNKLSTIDLGAISISSGPGSYTGLRVGGATAKAFAYSLSIPLIAVPTLLALGIATRAAYSSVSHFLPMIDARRDEVYTSLFDREMYIIWPDHAAKISVEFIEENFNGLPELVCSGDGSFKMKPFLPDYPNLVVEESIVCSARHLVKPAWNKFLNKESENPLHYVPRYLKPPNITQPRKTA